MPTPSSSPEISVTLHSQPDPSQVEWGAPDEPDESKIKWETKVAAVPESANAVKMPPPEFLEGHAPETTGPGLIAPISNIPIAAAQATNEMLGGVGSLVLPGKAGEKAREFAEGSAKTLEGLKSPEASVDVPLLGNMSISGLVGGSLPYAAATALSGGGLAALGASPEITAALSTLGPVAAPLLGRIKSARTPEERQAAIEDTNKALLGQLILHGAIQGVKALKPEVPTAKPVETLEDVTPEGLAVVSKPNGEIVKELPPVDPVLGEVSSAVLAHRAGVEPGDLNGFAKWFSDEYLNGKPVDVTKGKQIVSQTTDAPDSIKVELSDRDANIEGLWHELSQHANLPDGHTLTGDLVPHDNTAIAANAIDSLVPQGKPTGPRVGGISGRGISYPNDERGHTQRTLDYIRGVAQRDPVTGAAIYKTINARLATREALSWKNEQLAALNEEAARRVRKIPNAGVSAKYDLYPHVSEIADLMGGPTGAQEFVAAGIDSVLEGKRQMWADLAKSVKDADSKKMGKYLTALDALRTAQGIGKVIPKEAEMATKLSEDPVGAKNFISSIFDKASKNVPKVLVGGVDRATWEKAHPEYQKALEVWRRDGGPEDLFNEVQEERGGPFSEYLGPWGAYFPLVAMDQSGQPLHSGLNRTFMEPGNPHAKMATGQSPQYAADLRAINDDLAHSRSAVAKASALDFLKQSGIGVVADQKPLSFTVPGTTRQVAVSSQPFTLKDGSLLWVPDAIMKGGLREAMDRSVLDASDNVLKRVFRAINAFQMGGKLDLVAHNLAMAARFTKQYGNLGTWSDRSLGRLPVINYLSRSLESLNPEAWDVNQSALARDNLRFAVENGVIPKRVGEITTDPTWAALTGAQHVNKANPLTSLNVLTYGPQGTHIRTILQATDMIRRLNPDVSHQQYFKAISEYGLYTKELEGRIINGIKETIGPFATAGQSMARAGKRMLTAGGKMPFESQLDPGAIKARADYLISRGLGSSLILWYATHYFLTGKIPHLTEQKNSDGTTVPPTPLFGVRESDMKESVRKSPAWDWISKALAGDKQGERVLDLTAPDPVLRRGLRYTGVQGAYESYAHGGTIGQAVEKGMVDAINSRAQIAAGPPAQFLTTGALGVAPRLLTMHGDKGRVGPEFLQTAKTGLPGEQFGENLKAAGIQANPILARVAEAAGEGLRSDMSGTPDQRIVRFLSDLVNIRPVRVDTQKRAYNIMDLWDIEKRILMEKMKASH